MKKISFIINPVAGHHKLSFIKDLIETNNKSNLFDVDIIETKSPGHATIITRELLEHNSTNYIIAAGGDGTVNEVINGFSKNSETKFGVLPTGSGNDFVKNLNYPEKIQDVAQFLFSENFNTPAVYPGIAKYTDSDQQEVTKKFINAVGIGFDGYVAYLNQKEKALPGWLSYLITVLQALKNRQSLNCYIKMDDLNIEKELLLLTIGKGICSGGGFYLTPFASPFKEKLDLTTVQYCSISRILKSLPMAMFNKLHKVDEADFYELDEISIELDVPYYVHADGEILSDKVRSIDIRSDDNYIKIIRGK